MTSIAVWTGADHRTASTIYIVTDSRRTIATDNFRDDCRKAFACEGSPDIFGFYGDVAVPSAMLASVELSSALAPIGSGDARHVQFFELLKDATARMRTPVPLFGTIHVTREGRGAISTFRVWHTRWEESAWKDMELPTGDNSKLLFVEGSGASVLRRSVDACQRELGNVSRAVYTGFCDGLQSGKDAKSGGAPQLVGLFRDSGMGRHFGVIFNREPYFKGSAPPSLLMSDVIWKNELFENCDPNTLIRIPGQQAQPRLGRLK